MGDPVATESSAPRAGRFAELSAAHRRFLVVDELIGGAVVSFFVNLALGYIFFFKKPVVPLFGLSSITGDFLGMCFMLPLFTAIGATLLVNRAVAAGKMQPLPDAAMPRSRWLSWSGWARGAWVGVIACAVAAAPVIAFLHARGTTELTLSQFLWCKSIFAFFLGAAVTPPIGWWALAEASRKRRPGP